MTATEKLKQKLIHMMTGETITDPTRLDEKIEECDAVTEVGDFRDMLRCSGHDTGLDAPHSRHYESRSVAAPMLDGSWVGWTYWYGGGKHGQPSEMPWMEDAYDVTMEEVMMPVKVFKKTAPVQ